MSLRLGIVANFVALIIAQEWPYDPRFRTADLQIPRFRFESIDPEDQSVSCANCPIDIVQYEPCDPVNEIPQDRRENATPWRCQGEPRICGESCDGNTKCICDRDIPYNEPVCWESRQCANRPVCYDSGECQGDEVCVVTCCDEQMGEQIGRCMPRCSRPYLEPDPTPEPTPPPVNECACDEGTPYWECGTSVSWEQLECGPTAECDCAATVDRPLWQDGRDSACIQHTLCSSVMSCATDPCPPGYVCIPNTCCSSDPAKCLKCCDNEPIPEPTTRPTDATRRPTDATRRPTDVTGRPTDVTGRPTDVTNRPTDVTSRPTDATRRPTDATRRPTDATRRPTDATRRPTSGPVPDPPTDCDCPDGQQCQDPFKFPQVDCQNFEGSYPFKCPIQQINEGRLATRCLCTLTPFNPQYDFDAQSDEGQQECINVPQFLLNNENGEVLEGENLCPCFPVCKNDQDCEQYPNYQCVDVCCPPSDETESPRRCLPCCDPDVTQNENPFEVIF